MCTGGGRKPTSCANFLRTPLMRASRSPWRCLVDQRRSGGSRPRGRACRPAAGRPSSLRRWLGGARRGRLRRVPWRACCALAAATTRRQPRPPASSRNTRCGMPGNRGRARRDRRRRSPSDARRAEHLRGDLAADVVLLADARHHHRRGHRDQQRRDLRDQPVADREQDVAVGRLRRRCRPCCGHADDEAADDVDEQDQDAGHRVAAHELAGAVHRAEELGFLARPRRGGAWLPSRRSGRRSGRRRSPSACRASRRA